MTRILSPHLLSVLQTSDKAVDFLSARPCDKFDPPHLESRLFISIVSDRERVADLFRRTHYVECVVHRAILETASYILKFCLVLYCGAPFVVGGPGVVSLGAVGLGRYQVGV
jgi:hypothetical protein